MPLALPEPSPRGHSLCDSFYLLLHSLGRPPYRLPLRQAPSPFLSGFPSGQGQHNREKLRDSSEMGRNDTRPGLAVAPRDKSPAVHSGCVYVCVYVGGGQVQT